MTDRPRFPFMRARVLQEPAYSFMPKSPQPPEAIKCEESFTSFRWDPETPALPYELRVRLGKLNNAVVIAGTLFSSMRSSERWSKYYPDDMTIKEFDAVAKDNPELLDHYSYVRRTVEGNLVSTPIVVQDKNTILHSKMIPYIREAAKSFRRKEPKDHHQADYLDAVANSVLTGNFKHAQELWLKVNSKPMTEDEIEQMETGKIPPRLEFVLGLFDTENDKKKGFKYAWEAWSGVIDERKTAHSQKIVDAMTIWWEGETETRLKPMQARAIYTRFMAGLIYEEGWSGVSMPCQREWRDEIGSVFTIHIPKFKDDFVYSLEAFRKVIDPKKRQGVSDSFAETASMGKLVAHEVGHSLGVAYDLEKRMGSEETPRVKELYCDLVSLLGYLNMPRLSVYGDPMLDSRDREVALATYFAEGAIEDRDRYHKAFSVILKYCIDHGSIKIENGYITWDSLTDVKADLTNLFREVYSLQKKGTRAHARAFFRDFYEEDFFPKPNSRKKPANISSIIQYTQARLSA